MNLGNHIYKPGTEVVIGYNRTEYEKRYLGDRIISVDNTGVVISGEIIGREDGFNVFKYRIQLNNGEIKDMTTKYDYRNNYDKLMVWSYEDANIEKENTI